jgi:hypothetical protein
MASPAAGATTMRTLSASPSSPNWGTAIDSRGGPWRGGTSSEHRPCWNLHDGRAWAGSARCLHRQAGCPGAKAGTDGEGEGAGHGISGLPQQAIHGGSIHAANAAQDSESSIVQLGQLGQRQGKEIRSAHGAAVVGNTILTDYGAYPVCSSLSYPHVALASSMAGWLWRWGFVARQGTRRRC